MSKKYDDDFLLIYLFIYNTKLFKLNSSFSKSMILNNKYINIDDQNNLKVFNKFIPYLNLKDHYYVYIQNVLQYENISSTFIYYYLILNKYFIYQNKNILSIDTTSGMLETVLYLNKNKNENINLDLFHYIHPNINDYIEQGLKTEEDKLKKNYDLTNFKNIKIDYLTKYKRDYNKNYDIIHIHILRKNINTSKYHLQTDLITKAIIDSLNNCINIGSLFIIFEIRQINEIELKYIKNILNLLDSYFSKKQLLKIKNYYVTTTISFDNFNKELFNSNKNLHDKIIEEINQSEYIYPYKVQDTDEITKHVNKVLEKHIEIKENKIYKELQLFKDMIDLEISNKYHKFIKELCHSESKCIDIDTLQKINKEKDESIVAQLAYEYKKLDLPVKPEILEGVKEYSQKLIKKLYEDFNNITFNITNNNNLEDISYKKEDILDLLEFNKLSFDLKLLKSCIDSKSLEKWKIVTDKINIRTYLKKYIKDTLDMQVSRAFLKMYDILTEFDLIDFSKKETKTLHTCEAPGHFINAINHFIQSRNEEKEDKHIFNWTANSLNANSMVNREKYGYIFGDQYGFIKRHSKRWDWGPDMTGDITNDVNLEYYLDKYKNSVDLFTSDCGLSADTAEDMMNQEERLSILNLMQTFISLSSVKVGGHSVVKIFLPLSKPVSISIIYLFYLYFEEIYFTKQASGSLGSSEIYLVAKNKKYELSEQHRKIIKDIKMFFDPDIHMFTNYDKNFITELLNITNKFVNVQMDYLNRSFFYVDNKNIYEEHSKYFYDAKEKFAKDWIERNKLKKIKNNL
jgi:hypothetical protein